LKALKKKRKKLRKEKKSLPGATPFPFKFPVVYDEIALVVQDNISLSEVTFLKRGSEKKKKSKSKNKKSSDFIKGERIKVVGHIFGSDLKSQNTLRFLLQDLKSSPIFEDIQLIRSKALADGKYNSPGLQFELYVFPKTLS